MFFEDGKRRIDYILTYTLADKERDEKHADDREKRIRKREAFFSKFKENGLEYETQNCEVSFFHCCYGNLFNQVFCLSVFLTDHCV